MNKWLESTILAYIVHFSATFRPVVWEVGSRDGHDGVELAQRIYAGKNFWEDAKVVCIEPNPPQAKIIRNNYPQAEVFEVAASDRGGKQRFMVYDGDEGAVGSSSLDLGWKQDLPGHTIVICCNLIS